MSELLAFASLTARINLLKSGFKFGKVIASATKFASGETLSKNVGSSRPGDHKLAPF